MSYRSYQQVLDLSTKSKKTLCKPRPVQAESKRRTKSGCLTCRKRKKKCDEETTGGKCQACIRNFLDCCWPGAESAAPSPVAKLTEPAAKPVELVAVANSPQMTKKPEPTRGASAYPSPVSSPHFQAAETEETKKIEPLSLPALRIQKPRVQKRKVAKVPEFIVTSFNLKQALCQIK